MRPEKDPKIDELLNSFLDGELSPEDCAEVQRLVSEDKTIAQRLRQLERCRILVSSLPPAEPPAELVSGIKELLRSRSAGVGGEFEHIERRRGERHLLARQVLAAAVMIGLFGLMGAVVYKIVAPEGTARPIVAVKPAPTIKPEALPVETEKTVAAEDKTGISLYSLQLQTTDFVAVDAFVNKLLDESSWLNYEVTKEGRSRSVYRVLCSRGGLETLVSDLAAVWSKFDSATLVVHTEDIGRYVAVESVSPEQITDIANQDKLEGRIKLAKDFAVLNTVEQVSQEGRMLALVDRVYPELTTIPRPVLTSGEKRVAPVPESPSDWVRVDLNIIVTGHK
ncbi:MAG: hypothetical protein MUO27_08390 [Sedimentisphaerales bacterium]|nr:hypothetical protein [Sedimentisphaerales bacterium]